MYISVGLNKSNFEAKAGIVGGAINLGRIDTFCQLKEDSGIEPFHKLGIQLDVVEVCPELERKKKKTLRNISQLCFCFPQFV